MPFAQGEVVVLPFPYSDMLAEKRRPAVVVSKPALERTHGVMWVAMITSAAGRARKDDVRVSQLQRAGLPVASVIRPSKLATIEPGRVLRTAGTLTRGDLYAVLEALRRYL